MAELIRGFSGADEPGRFERQRARTAALFGASFVIEEGTAAVLLQHGQAELLPPGSYQEGSLLDRLRQFFVGGTPVVVVLMDVNPVELRFSIDELLTAESVKVAADGALAVRITNPIAFNNVVIKGLERLGRTELADRLIPELRLSLLDALGNLPLKQLRSGANLQQQLRLRIQGEIRRALEPWGMELTDLRGLTVYGDVLDRFTDQEGALFQRGTQLELDALASAMERREFRQQAAQAIDMERLRHERDQLQQRDALDHAQRTNDIQQESLDLDARRRIAEHGRDAQTEVEFSRIDHDQETRQTELEVDQSEKLSQLYRRAQAASMDRLRTDEEVEKFLADFNKEKLLRNEDVESLRRGLLERREDHETARAYLLKRIELEMEIEQQRISLRGAQELDAVGIEHELAMRRKQFDLEQAESLARHERQMAEDRDRLNLDEERDLADLRTMERLKKLNRDDAEHAARIEAERLRSRSGASVAALLSLMREQGDSSGAAEADQALQELVRTEKFKGRSTDEILAMQAAESPEVAKIFQARATAGGYEEAMQARIEAGREALDHERRHSQEMRETYEKHSSAMADSSAQAMQRVSEIAQAVAGSHRGETVVVNPPPGASVQGATVVNRTPGSGDAGVACPSCRAVQRGGAAFCDQCGARIKPQTPGAVCRACQAAVPPDNRFCPQCGATIAD